MADISESIRERAQELGRLIGQSEEYKALGRARERINEDRDAVQRLNRLGEYLAVVSGRDVSVKFDMQTFASLAHGDQILIQRSPYTITFLHPEGWSYYDTLREKLHWNEYPSVEGKLTRGT